MKPLLAAILAAALTAASDPHRPVYHFTPPSNWMNDPNGLVFFDGEYHLFYQHNPFGNRWGHMSWGHSVSPDLFRWQHLPVALREENGIMIFSGSAVVDTGNTSGLCPKGQACLIAIYTGHTPQRQHQSIAYSHDRGRTWTKYSGNPVLDIVKKDFRDPKVVWNAASKQWIMVVALPQEKRVSYYSSPDLKAWTHLSDFGPAGATGGIWECPDLFELDGRWVLVVSLNPGGPAGGSGGQYFVGDFDGRTFSTTQKETRWIDYGPDMYATVSFFGAPGRSVWLGWMSNWLYAQEEPTNGWRTAQSLPRELRLSNGRVLQQPAREWKQLRSPAQPSGFRGDSYEIEAEIDLNGGSEAGFQIRKGGEERTIVGVRAGQVFVDRTRSGAVAFHKSFSGTYAAPVDTSRPVRLQIFVDRSSVEVFVNGGEPVITSRIFPSAASDGFEQYANGGARVRSLRLYRLSVR
jgi:fructan beta-fructosidase